MVSGTQAERAHVNNVIVMKMSNLHKTAKVKEDNEDNENEEEEEEDDEKEPDMETALIKHNGSVNRIRV